MRALPSPKPDVDATPTGGNTGGVRGIVDVSERRAANQLLKGSPTERRAASPVRPVGHTSREGAASPDTRQAAPAAPRIRKSAAGQSTGSAATSNRSTEAERLLENYLVKRQAMVLQLVAEVLDARSLATGLTSLADALHHRFDCSRVVIGIFHASRLRIETISQQASFDPRSDEVALLKDALQEACDQDVIVHYPVSDDDTVSTDAHQALCAGRPDARLLSLPLCHAGEVIGAMLLQRPVRADWSRFTLELLGQVAELSAALISLRCESERGLIGVARRSLRDFARMITGPHHVLAKSVVALLLFGSLFAALVPVTHRVNAQAEVVPTTRRVISAPIDGFVDSVHVHVGDRLSAGDVLLKLDTRQLSLEQQRLTGEIRGIETEMRAALASRDRKETVVLFARKSQAAAELARVEQQLERAVLRSPIDGIIVSGNINEIVGAPVKLGDSLLQIAPLQGQDVHLLIDESDIGHVAIGQHGALSLTSSPGRALPFEVSAIHPIAQSAEGRNRIRVEATLPADAAAPLPGQTGIGKIAVGQASLLWVWTHRFTDWARQRGWEWFG